MQSTTLIVLACLVAVVMANTQHQHLETNDQAQVEAYEINTPVHERSSRNKRGLLLLKKKLLLGALGLKAAKIGALGAGVAGVLALKKKSVPAYRPPVIHEVHPYYGWSG
ncbi:unnamed protein product [Leptidea sinapis]|uniref:Uncharacterized protein n=1 Tax=Leptidea sinapis TaxID=189913 RepID=A0A5E4QK69_9NEOP|nr:unnamed protein product [Leptidea sinapis]